VFLLENFKSVLKICISGTLPFKSDSVLLYLLPRPLSYQLKAVPASPQEGIFRTERFGLEGTFRGHLAQPPELF